MGLGVRATRTTAALLLLLTFLPTVSATDEGAAEYGLGLTVLPVVVAGGILNIVSANLNRKPELLWHLDQLMTKNNWHIVLVQETGIITKNGLDPHLRIRQQMRNKVVFNSPSEAYLRAKLCRKATRALNAERERGDITEAQYTLQLAMLSGATVNRAGGMAIMLQLTMVPYASIERVAPGPTGSDKCKRMMSVCMKMGQ